MQDEEEDTKPKHQNSKSDIAGIPDTLNGEFMHHWVKDIHSRIAVLEEDLGAKDETAIEGKLEYGARDMFYTVPRVRECDWNHYKNKYSEEDCNASIDVLVSSHDFVADVEAEYVARMSPDQRQKYIGVPRAWIRPATLNEVQTGPRFERIRINSGIILAYLDKTNNRTSWTASLPHTFYKPFKTIIHFHYMMEESLRVLESKYGMVCESESAGTTQSAVKSEEGAIGHGGTAMSQDASAIIGDNNDLLGAPESQQSINFPQTPRHGNFIHRDEVPAFMDSVQAYRDMKVYVNFIDERIMPSYRMFEGANYSSNKKVRYDELWWLFRIGELLYEQAQPDKELSAIGIQGPQSAPTTHRLWRLHDIYLPIQIVEVMPKDLLHMQGVEFQEKKDTISINVYHIDFDGGDYSAITKTFHIPQYDGEKEIHELPIFPLRFMKEGASIFEKLKERGRTFQTVLSKGKAAMAYDGWTLICDPTGDVMEDFDGNEMTTPEYINSDVIIDFREAFLTYPHWQPDFPKYIKTNLQSETRCDPYPIIQWVDADRSKQVRQWSKMVAVKESVDNLRWNEFSATDSFLCDLPDDIGTRTATELVLSDEDLALLPSRLFAYALRDRKFIVIDISKLKEIPPVSNQFDDLEIPQNHKTMILSIVYDHFEKKKVRQAAALQGFEAHDQDFIRGKGRGIVILLHGAPGVGKTATAEAVAHAQNKPLFPITCGDLGTTPEVVEERLQETFRLANLWDCILLMDEAEIFLSQRQKNDDSISRNAMVSVFLRILEYYPGILFLTTNRPGALDEAVKSRVHLSLRYPALEIDETLAIFQKNSRRLQIIEEERARLSGEKMMKVREGEILGFASAHFHKDPSARWNGRQIRNAFQIAASLAHYDKHINPNLQEHYIGKKHFEDVAKASRDYDRYRQDLFSGKNDDELAQDKEDRGYPRDDRIFPSRETSMAESPGATSYRGQASYGRYSTPPRR